MGRCRRPMPGGWQRSSRFSVRQRPSMITSQQRAQHMCVASSPGNVEWRSGHVTTHIGGIVWNHALKGLDGLESTSAALARRRRSPQAGRRRQVAAGRSPQAGRRRSPQVAAARRRSPQVATGRRRWSQVATARFSCEFLSVRDVPAKSKALWRFLAPHKVAS